MRATDRPAAKQRSGSRWSGELLSGGFATSTFRLRMWTWGVLCLALLVAFLSDRTAALHAQQNPEPAAADAADAPAVEGEGDAAEVKPGSESFGQLIFNGDLFGTSFYLILALFSIVATSVAIERLINLRRHKVLPPAFAERLTEILRRRDKQVLEKLSELVKNQPSPVANILQAALLRAGRPLVEVEKAMEDAASREMSEMRSRHRPLSVVGSVAPLVGLLGTVVGMIFAFRVSSQEGLGKAERLAEGIYLALMTTAGGLTIAIPCLLLVAWFNSRSERYMREIDTCLLETLPSFARFESTGQTLDNPTAEQDVADREMSVVGSAN